MWDRYKSVINNKAQALLHNDTIIWNRKTRNIDRFGEGENIKYQQITLKCLVEYNYKRTWPIDIDTRSGQIDPQSICIILNKEYLKKLGYVNSQGLPLFDLGIDYFTHKGLDYTDYGDTLAGQASDEPLFYYIVLKRKTKDG